MDPGLEDIGRAFASPEGRQWTGIWYTFIADLLREWGYLGIYQARQKRELRPDTALAFLEKLELLYKLVDLSAVYSKFTAPGKAPDLDDIHSIGKILEELNSPYAVERLK